MNRHVLIALLVAPLAASLVVWLLLASFGGSEAKFWLIFFIPVSYGCAALLGVPGHLLLAKLKMVRMWHYAVSGLIIGLVPSLVVWALTFSNSGFSVALAAAIFGALLGPIAAVMFWSIAVRRKTARAGV
jgi:hypothetical protein